MNAKTAGNKSAEPASTVGRGKLAWLRAVVVVLLGIVACAAFGAYVVVHWTERQILTTDNWVALVSPLPKNPEVSSALGNYIGAQVFSTVPVRDEIAAALPPRASFLADPLTDQLRSLTTRLAQKLVSGDGFQTVWVGANRIAMNRLASNARGQTPPLRAKISERFNLNLASALPQLRNALGSAGNAIPALQPASQQAVAVSTNLHARAQRVRQAIKLIDYLAAVLPWLIVATLLWALAWSRYRRHALLVVVTSIVIVMLLELIGIKLLRQLTLDQVRNSANLGAVGYVYDVLVGWLKHMIYIVIVVMIALLGLLMLGGPASWAQRARTYIRLDRLTTARPVRAWRDARIWLGRWEYYFWLGAVVLILAIVAGFNVVTARVLTNAVLIVLCMFATLHIIATPPVPHQAKA